MKFPAYRTINDGNDRTSQGLPAGWDERRLKFVASCNDETLSEDTDPDYEMAYVDISSVSLEDGITSTELVSFEKAPSRARRIVRDGDTIISTVRTYLKAIAAIDKPPRNLIVSTGFSVIRPFKFLDSRFLGYALQNTKFIDRVVAHSTGVSYPAINPTELIAISVRYPIDRAEQKHIANFLDWKTGQIDALIAKKRALLDRLKEQRLAIITHAVTRGLDSNAPLRESGIPWIRHVPRHWGIKRLRFACRRIEQGWSPQCENQPADDGVWGVMKVGCVNGDIFDPTDNKALPTELSPAEEYELIPGDILISRANTRELLGSAAVVPDNTRSRLLLCDKLFRVSPDAEIRNDFLVYLLRTPVSRFQYEREATGASASMQNIGQGTIKDLIVMVPPIAEQDLICDFIRKNNQRIDSLVDSAQQVIFRLTEYRSALITAATTGQIDVRNVTIPTQAA